MEYFARPGDGFAASIQSREGLDVILSPENSVDYQKAAVFSTSHKVRSGQHLFAGDGLLDAQLRRRAARPASGRAALEPAGDCGSQHRRHRLPLHPGGYDRCSPFPDPAA